MADQVIWLCHPAVFENEAFDKQYSEAAMDPCNLGGKLYPLITFFILSGDKSLMEESKKSLINNHSWI